MEDGSGSGAGAPRVATTRRRFLRELGGGLAAARGLGGPGGLGGLLASGCAPAVRAAPRPFTLAQADALLLVLADTHSAYERYPQILAAVDMLRARHPRQPLTILFNGDLFERGNVVALRGEGRVDLALLRALAERAPLLFNLGNHEGALFELPEAVRLLREQGATVVSNVLDRRGGRPLAPPAAALEVAGRSLAAVGLATNDLATYRAAVRESLRIPNGPEYAAARLPELLGGMPLRVVLSHEGTLDDREMLPLVPDGTLVVGGHDHLSYAHRQGRTLYLHTGSWAEALAVVGVRLGPAGAEWIHEELPLAEQGPGDAALAALVRREEAEHVTGEERAIIGHMERALPLREAALLAAAALRDAAGADVGMIANTTFGTGLPAGPITRHRFDAFVRFDGTIQIAPTDGATLQAILRRTNQTRDTPFAERSGEFLFATPLERVDPARRYTLATVDWVRQHAVRYLGTALDFSHFPGTGLKEVVIRGLGG